MRAVALAALLLVAAAAPADGAVEVRVEALRSDAGSVRCWLFADRAGFPIHLDRALRTARARIDGRQARCGFEAVPPGDYAVAVLHDENDNGEVDTNFLGIPKEGLGASRDAPGFFGPPSFDDARFHHGQAPTELVVHVRY